VLQGSVESSIDNHVSIQASDPKQIWQ